MLVVHFDTGGLFRVRLSDKQVTKVDLGGYSLTGGDGMVLTDDNVLYVVRIFDSLVAKLRLNAAVRPRSAAVRDQRPELPRSDDGGDRRQPAARGQQPVHRTAVRPAVDGVEHPASVIE